MAEDTAPAPMARAIIEAWGPASPATTGARIPAVVVATVAEPVAWRSATAISQASRM